MTPVGLLVRFRIVVQRSFIRYYKAFQQYKAYDVILTHRTNWCILFMELVACKITLTQIYRDLIDDPDDILPE